MSCNITTFESGKKVDLCVNPKCDNHNLNIKRSIPIISFRSITKEEEIETLKKDLLWINMNLAYYKKRFETCEKMIAELESS